MIKRYDPLYTFKEMIEDPEGVYCKWSDVEKELSSLKAERDALAQFAEARRVQINELLDENAELKRTPRTTGGCSPTKNPPANFKN